MSGRDYIKLYNLQDKILSLLSGHYGNLYLTGGTALDRFYLNHRYSEDLDFFMNADSSFVDTVNKIRNLIGAKFIISKKNPVLFNDFVRFWVEEDGCELKIEFVNDVPYYSGKIHLSDNIPVDNVQNILSNKLTAIVSRDEPKDIFDIVSISLSFSFNWQNIFECSIQKAIVAEQNVAERIETFPVELLIQQPWLKHPVHLSEFKNYLKTIANDFLFAKDNSLGKSKTPINEAVPIIKP
jgi:hypothetical protein